MPETRGIPDPEPTRRERIEPLVRELLAGHPQGAVRRIGLYIATAGFVLLSLAFGGAAGVILGGLGLITLLLLATTDDLA